MRMRKRVEYSNEKKTMERRGWKDGIGTRWARAVDVEERRGDVQRERGSKR
jgi:hypothetical protein